MSGVESLLRRAHLFILLQLCVVDLPDLGQLGPVVRVLCRVVHPRSSRGCRRCGCRRRASTFLWTGHALRQQHVVQPHELGIWRLFLLGATDTQHCNDRSGSEVSHTGRTLQWHDALQQAVRCRSLSCSLRPKPGETWPRRDTVSGHVCPGLLHAGFSVPTLQLLDRTGQDFG